MLTRKPTAALPGTARRVDGALTTGAGLPEAVQGSDVVLHRANPFRPTSGSGPRRERIPRWALPCRERSEGRGTFAAYLDERIRTEDDTMAITVPYKEQDVRIELPLHESDSLAGIRSPRKRNAGSESRCELSDRG